MSNPYPFAEQQLRSLTDSGVAHYRKLNDRDEREMEELRKVRAVHVAEIASIDEVMADLNETVARRLSKMRGDTISLLPTDVRVAPSQDERSHSNLFGGPATQVMPAVEPDPPAGFCIHCGAAVWRTSISSASPKGFQHSFGATCNPEDAESKVADLGEEVPS